MLTGLDDTDGGDSVNERDQTIASSRKYNGIKQEPFVIGSQGLENG